MKQMRMGSLALSVLLASSLSAPTTVMAAETTTSETNQTEVSAAADSAVTEQPVASASTDQAAESAPEEQTVSSAPGEQPAASDPDEQTAESASSELAVVPESMPASDKHSANERTLDLAAVATPSDVIVEDSKVANSSEPAEEASASNEQSPESTAAGKDVQPAPQQETKKGIEEPAVDKATTAPNNVNEAAPRSRALISHTRPACSVSSPSLTAPPRSRPKTPIAVKRLATYLRNLRAPA